MFQFTIDRDFARWRSTARQLLAAGVPPEEVLWVDDDAGATLLGAGEGLPPSSTMPGTASPAVPRAFVELAALVACHRDPDRWNLLYRCLWRLARDDRALLDRLTDDDVVRLHVMERAVRRDRHKMTAFVRFRLVGRPADPVVADVVGEDGRGTEPAAAHRTERYVAWHRPDHFIVRLTAPFFARRFACLNWTILTPDDSAAWDGERLTFGPGVSESAAPAGDDLEALWRTYYANIFNPARIKIRAMKRELPVRHWPTLPETQLIPDLLNEAPRRVEEMIRKAKQAAKPTTGRSRPGHTDGGAEPDLDIPGQQHLFADPPARADRTTGRPGTAGKAAGPDDAGDGDQLPATRKEAEADAGAAPPADPAVTPSETAAAADEANAPPRMPARGRPAGWGAEQFVPPTLALPQLAAASKTCRGCDLCDVGTQTVFGEGPPDAVVMFVGEQPGDQEDRAGRPFVGPAGQLLDEALVAAGVDRGACYVTNTVKHFKWEPRGKRRIHAKPNAREVSACLPWLEAEIRAVKPRMVVCLGSTAAQALLGRDFRVTSQRGQPMESEWAPWTMATIHPSALLRIPDEAMRESGYKAFVADLSLVAQQLTKERR